MEIKDYMGGFEGWQSLAAIFSQAIINFLFTNMRIQMVSGLRLAWRREMVSQPPEKICSTATVDSNDRR